MPGAVAEAVQEGGPSGEQLLPLPDVQDQRAPGDPVHHGPLHQLRGGCAPGQLQAGGALDRARRVLACAARLLGGLYLSIPWGGVALSARRLIVVARCLRRSPPTVSGLRGLVGLGVDTLMVEIEMGRDAWKRTGGSLKSRVETKRHSPN
eukprot:2083545-Pyramimonas_sp.AAC.1